MQIIFILTILLLTAGISFLIRKTRMLGIINVIAQLIICCFVVNLCFFIAISKNALVLLNFFYIDSLSAFFLLVISISGLASAVYSVDYISHEAEKKAITERKASLYFVLFNLFLFSMFFVVIVNNLWAMWIAIEMTTLISAFLVGFYNNKTSVEAAWKYIIICSAGITLALFGTLLFYYSAALHGGHDISWTGFCSIASKLDPDILKIGFVFIIVGYGTKAGLVPMHTWLPDAHSQSPSPISALLSGVLLKTAIYSILRFAIIVNRCAGINFTENLFLLFGILSLAVSAGFILIQKDLKRLLAYHSVEHVGIISVGLGCGGALGLYGALLHIFNHAVTKSLMFFGAGNITRKYGTNNMHVIKGVIKTMPFTGILVFIGVFALAGSPPFSIFMSEIMIVIAGFQKGNYAVSLLLILFTVIIFAAIVHHFSKMLLGKKPENISVEIEPVLGRIAFICLAFFIIYMGFQIPWVINELLRSAVDIIQRG